MNLIRCIFVFCFGTLFLASCVTYQPTPGPLTPAPGADQYELTGHYYEDKYYFFPNGRNFEMEQVYLQALLEGAENYSYEPNTAFSPEQNLAIEYDAMATAAKFSDNGWENYGIILGKVGRWKEAADAFKKTTGINTTSAGAWGNLGVAQHALGNYREYVASFEKAAAIDPSYFKNRQNQKKIWQASKEGHSVTP